MPNLAPVTPEIRLVDGKTVTTSRAVAAFFKREHRDVTRKIEKLDCSDRFLTANFYAVPYEHNGNIYTEYQITRDGFTFLAMGFAGKRAAAFKEAYIAEFNRMEQSRQQALALPVHQRLLVCLNSGQTEKVSEVPQDAYVVTPEQMKGVLREQGYAVVTQGELVLLERAADRLCSISGEVHFLSDELKARGLRG